MTYNLIVISDQSKLHLTNTSHGKLSSVRHISLLLFSRYRKFLFASNTFQRTDYLLPFHWEQLVLSIGIYFGFNALFQSKENHLITEFIYKEQWFSSPLKIQLKHNYFWRRLNLHIIHQSNKKKKPS